MAKTYLGAALMSQKPAGLSRKRKNRPTYAQAVEWIANEDEPGEVDENEIASLVSVALVAALFGVDAQEVARDVVRFREPDADFFARLQAHRRATLDAAIAAGEAIARDMAARGERMVDRVARLEAERPEEPDDDDAGPLDEDR